jgi:nucleolar protein 53
MAPAQTKVAKKQPGRKGTKQWRKNVDISEVEVQLEELRQEEIDGGKIHERKSEDLFFVDKDGSDKVREAIKRKTLVIDDIMKPKSAIEGIVSRKVKSTTTKMDVGHKTREVSKNIKLQIEREAKKKQAKGVTPGHAQLLKQKRLQEKKQTIRKSKGGYDLWGEEKKEDVNPYLEPILPKPVQKPVVENKRPKAIPNVAITHPGNSYKPSSDDHRSALELAANEELKKIEERERIQKSLSYPPELDHLPDEEVQFDTSEEGEGNEDEDQGETKKEKRLVRKKTKAEINRQKRIKDQERKEKLQQEEKRKIKQLNRYF